MSAMHYKALISYLPGMAAVVNSFQTPDVQVKVFDALMQSLNDKLAAEGVTSPGTRVVVERKEPALRMKDTPRNGHGANEDQELAHDLVEGESIHAMEMN